MAAFRNFCKIGYSFIFSATFLAAMTSWPYSFLRVKSIGSDDASCLIKEVEVEEEEQMKYRNRKISKRNKKTVNKVNLSRKGLSRKLKG